MTAEDITSTISIAKDAVPNLGLKMHLIRVASTENGDWVEMSTAPYGYTDVYWAVALVAQASEAVGISDNTKLTFSAGSTDTITVLVAGV